MENVVQTIALPQLPAPAPIIGIDELPGFIEIVPEAPKNQKKPSNNAVGMFRLENASDLKRLLEAIRTLQDEVTVRFEADKMIIRLMDPSRVAMIDYTIEKQYFEEWQVFKPGFTCFNVETVLNIALSRLKKDTKVSVEFNEHHLVLKLKDDKERERTFPLLEANTEDVPSPKLYFDACYKVVGMAIKDDIEDLAKVSDHITLLGEVDSLTLKAEGDLAKGQNRHQRGDNGLLDIAVAKDSKATFSISYLLEFFRKGTWLGEVFSLEFSTDMPIKIVVNSARFGYLNHYLAPRISCD